VAIITSFDKLKKEHSYLEEIPLLFIFYVRSPREVDLNSIWKKTKDLTFLQWADLSLCSSDCFFFGGGEFL
jgi:hypothetical protein